MTTAMVDLTQLRWRLAHLDRAPTSLDVADALHAEGYAVSDAQVMEVTTALRRGSTGAGRLDPLLALPGVTDVIVNGPDQVYVDTGRGLQRTEVTFDNADEVRALAQRLVAASGRRLDTGMPYADARLPTGVRVHAVLDGIADPGPCLSLRVPSRASFGMADLVNTGAIPPEGAKLLTALVRARAPFLISGGTGSGKTTLLATMLGLVGPDERLLIVEDSRELSPDHPHVVRLESRPANAEAAGAVSLSTLVRQALRMRPDRLVVGEVRGGEVADMLTAMNTGHEGGCGTVHANSASDVPARLEALAALGGMNREALHAQLGAAANFVIHLVRVGGRRRVAEIVALLRDSNTGWVQSLPAVSFTKTGLVFGPARERLEAALMRAEEET